MDNNQGAREYGIVILLDALGTRERIIDDINSFLTDWNSVLIKLEENVEILERQLALNNFRTGIKVKEIFDNTQIFYPTGQSADEPPSYIDFSGGNAIWWTIQHSADLLTNLIRYAITKRIFFRGCISMGYIQEFRNAYFSKSMIENADLAENLEMIGVIAGPSCMRVLNNKSYSSSPRFYHFVKYGRKIPIKRTTTNLRRVFDRLAVLNLANTSKSVPDDVTNQEIEEIITEQINVHQRNKKVLRKWENMKKYIEYVPRLANENLFL